MQKLISACLVVSGLAMLNVARAAPDAQLGAVLQLGYAECKSAHVLRSKDLPLAKQTYARYLAIKDQLTGLDASHFTSGDPDVARVVDYCETVRADLARSEAMPIIQQGVVACGLAAKAVQRGNSGAAVKALAQFDEYRARAVELAPGVLDVYSVMAGVRRCERVAAELESLRKQQRAISAKVARLTGHLAGVLAACEAVEAPANEIVVAEVEDPVATAAALEVSVNILQQQLAESQQELAETPGAQLLTDASMLGSKIQVATAETREAIAACHAKLTSAIVASGTTVSELNAEIQKREAAKAAAEKAAAEVAARARAQLARQQETPDERRARLENNADSYTLVKRVAPEFPSRALRTEKDGYVVVEYTIGVDGSVLDPVIIESEPGKMFNKAALNAVSQWEYAAEFPEHAEPEVALTRTRFTFALR